MFNKKCCSEQQAINKFQSTLKNLLMFPSWSNKLLSIETSPKINTFLTLPPFQSKVCCQQLTQHPRTVIEHVIEHPSFKFPWKSAQLESRFVRKRHKRCRYRRSSIQQPWEKCNWFHPQRRNRNVRDAAIGCGFVWKKGEDWQEAKLEVFIC